MQADFIKASDAIKFGWGKFKIYWKGALLAMAVIIGVSVFFSGLERLLQPATVSVERFAGLSQSANDIFFELLDQGYIDFNGFRVAELDSRSDLILDAQFADDRDQIYDVLTSVDQFTFLNSMISFVLGLMLNIFNMLFFIAVGRVTLHIVDNKPVTKSDLQFKSVVFVQYLIATILTGIMTVLGYLFLIVPGVIIGIGLSFVQLIIIDREISAIDAIKLSWASTKGKKWQLFKCMIVLGLFNLFGVLCLLVGVIVTYVVTFFAWAYIYRYVLPNETITDESNPNVTLA